MTDLAAIRERHVIHHSSGMKHSRYVGPGPDTCQNDRQLWPCDVAALLAHIDALGEAVEGLPDQLGPHWEMDAVDRAAVLDILGGKE